MNYLVLVLRAVHILAGVFWVGSSLVFALFVGPAVAATADSGQKVMAHLVTRAAISMRITIAAILTVLAGAWLYWIDSGGLTSAWQRSGPGLGFGIGGLLATIGLVFGIMVGRNNHILGSLAAEIQGKPTPEQLGRIQAAQGQLKVVGPISNIALILALLCMATARYWVF
jgi:uncharacterized membrane protein